MLHTLKIWPAYAEAVADGRKRFEVRRNDRGFNAGDLVRFETWEARGLRVRPDPLAGRTFRITYVHSGWGVAEGFVVFGIAPTMMDYLALEDDDDDEDGDGGGE